MPDRTIIYYTANTEDPAFEERIRENLVKAAGGIPIISVSRKPIDLGHNICVGETPVCYMNEWRQLLLGLKAATTTFCITAEADCLYPPDYFHYTPPVTDQMYYYDNLWIVWKYKGGFWRKTGHCEGAEMCGRKFWIARLEPLLKKYGDGWDQPDRAVETDLVRRFFPSEGIFTGPPVISFKTRDGVSYRTTFINHRHQEIPYWGSIQKVKEIFRP